MRPFAPSSTLGRRTLISVLPGLGAATLALVPAVATAQAASSVLPSWNDGPAKQAILDFVRATTD
jgi:hypothetical protein